MRTLLLIVSLILTCPNIYGQNGCEDLFGTSNYFPELLVENIDMGSIQRFGDRLEIYLKAGKPAADVPLPEKFLFLVELYGTLRDRLETIKSMDVQIGSIADVAQLAKLSKYRSALSKAERWGKQTLIWLEEIKDPNSPLLTYGRVSEIEYSASRVLSFFATDIDEILEGNSETMAFIDQFLASARIPQFQSVGSIAIYRVWDHQGKEAFTKRDANIAFIDNIFLGTMGRGKIRMGKDRIIRPFEIFDSDFKDPTKLVYVPTTLNDYFDQKKQFMKMMNAKFLSSEYDNRTRALLHKFLFETYYNFAVFPSKIQLQSVRNDLEVYFLKEKTMDRFIEEAQDEIAQPIAVREYLLTLRLFFQHVDNYLGKWL